MRLLLALQRAALTAAFFATTTLLPAGVSAATQEEADALADAWCTAIMRNDEVTAVNLMSLDLQALVAQARLASDAYAATHPNDKPPLGDGLPLTSYPDVVTSCKTVNLTAAGGPMLFIPGGNESAGWSDLLIFAVGPDGALRVADVVYAPDNQVRLSDSLRAVTETVE